MKTVVVYGSMTGNAERIAKTIGAAFDAIVMDGCKADAAEIAAADLLIFGASTWGMGDLQDDMASFLNSFSSMNVSAKKAAVFGVGDQCGFSDTYVDGIADMADALREKNIQLIGLTSTDGYGHSGSRGQDGDMFLGLALDEDNESGKTDARIECWVAQLKSEFEG